MPYPLRLRKCLVYKPIRDCVSQTYDRNVRIVFLFTKTQSTSICLQIKAKRMKTDHGTGSASMVDVDNDGRVG